MTAAPSPARPVAEPPSLHTYFDVSPESPDGRHLTWFAFDGKPLDRGAVMLAPREGGAAVTVARCTGNAHGGAMQGWLDEAHVYFSAGGQVQIADLQGRIVQRCTGAVDTIDQCHRRGLAPSANWRKAGGEPPSEEACYRVDLDSGRVTELLDRGAAWRLLGRHMDLAGVPIDAMGFKHTKWAPDGRQWLVVFTNEGTRRTYPDVRKIKVLLVADAEGGNLRFIGAFGHHPQWLPDSSGIYAFAGHEIAPGRLLRWHAAGGDPSILADLPWEGHPNLRPDGRQMVTDGYRGDTVVVYLHDLEHGTGRTLLERSNPSAPWQTGHPPGRICHAHPVWSPDGRRLYVNLVVGELPQFHVMEPAA